ncbi:hypothetical protein EDC04DRAFT_1974414 [Pisolithus marmoratus]|nr:hypothetical protein EDC04DRAFT_1974414 [Pisolithus marmoratus]
MANPTIHVVLCAPSKPKDAPSFSGFCQKLEVFLRYSGISYEHREVYPYHGPKKKVPFAEISHDGKTVVVPDSHFIIGYLVENKLVNDPDDLAELAPEQRAESRAFQAYVEETLYSAIIYERWLINFWVTRQDTFGNLPWVLQYFMGWYFLRRVKSALWAAGMGRHSWEEVQTLQKEVIDALEVKLRKHKYFHGDGTPSRIDLTVYGFLANILTCKGNPYFTDMILKSAVLSSFVKEMTTALFPEYKDLLKEVEGNM